MVLSSYSYVGLPTNTCLDRMAVLIGTLCNRPRTQFIHDLYQARYRRLKDDLAFLRRSCCGIPMHTEVCPPAPEVTEAYRVLRGAIGTHMRSSDVIIGTSFRHLHTLRGQI